MAPLPTQESTVAPVERSRPKKVLGSEGFFVKDTEGPLVDGKARRRVAEQDGDPALHVHAREVVVLQLRRMDALPDEHQRGRDLGRSGGEVDGRQELGLEGELLRAPVAGEPRVGRGHRRAGEEQRVVRVAEDRDVGHREGAQRLAVVAAGEAHEAPLGRASGVAPGVEAHLERDLGGGRAVGRVERVAEPARGELPEPLGELDRGTVREAREHRVLEQAELRLDRGADAGDALACETLPAAAHGEDMHPEAQLF